MDKVSSKKNAALTTLDAIFFIALTCVLAYFAATSWVKLSTWGMCLRFILIFFACSLIYFIVKGVLRQKSRAAKALCVTPNHNLDNSPSSLTEDRNTEVIEGEFEYEGAIAINVDSNNILYEEPNGEVIDTEIENESTDNFSYDTGTFSARLKELAEEHEERRKRELERINREREKKGQKTSSSTERKPYIEPDDLRSGKANSHTQLKKAEATKTARIKMAIQKCRLAKVIYDDGQVYDRSGRLLGIVKPGTMKIMDSVGDLIAFHSHHSFSANGKKVGIYDKTVIKDFRGRTLIINPATKCIYIMMMFSVIMMGWKREILAEYHWKFWRRKGDTQLP